ncbi:MAG: antitoxin Xre/MbcA/ParS toxin-binding domain-containing protein [Bacteroidota bacterium]
MKTEKDKHTGAPSKPYAIDEDTRSDFLVMEPYTPYLRSPLAKLGAIKQGLKPAALSDLITVTGATQIDVAKWLDITEPTLRKHIQSTKGLNAGISEHVIQLFELFNKGMDTFGSIDEFKSWLKHYNPAIDAIPFDLLDTITGINIILSELIRIDYGVTA